MLQSRYRGKKARRLVEKKLKQKRAAEEARARRHEREQVVFKATLHALFNELETDGEVRRETFRNAIADDPQLQCVLFLPEGEEALDAMDGDGSGTVTWAEVQSASDAMQEAWRKVNKAATKLKQRKRQPLYSSS